MHLRKKSVKPEFKSQQLTYLVVPNTMSFTALSTAASCATATVFLTLTTLQKTMFTAQDIWGKKINCFLSSLFILNLTENTSNFETLQFIVPLYISQHSFININSGKASSSTCVKTKPKYYQKKTLDKQLQKLTVSAIVNGSWPWGDWRLGRN